jgi:REP element-mobilizing transposase RayT
MYSEPLGYFITFTTRGTWLHGDARGSIRRNAGFLAADPEQVNIETENLNVPPLLLLPEDRIAVENGLRELCVKRSWVLHEINVRTNHIHIVVTANDKEPDRVMSDLKSKGTLILRKLKRIDDKQKPWTRQGSMRYIFTQADFDAVCCYVKDGQN